MLERSPPPSLLGDDKEERFVMKRPLAKDIRTAQLFSIHLFTQAAIYVGPLIADTPSLSRELRRASNLREIDAANQY